MGGRAWHVAASTEALKLCRAMLDTVFAIDPESSAPAEQV
jgi:hypothetical protein